MSRFLIHLVQPLLMTLGMFLFETVLPQPAHSQCQPSMTISHTNVDELSPSDIDFEHFESHSSLFTVMLTNTSSTSCDVVFTGTFDIFLADGSLSGYAGTFTSNTINLTSAGVTFTNLDLGRSGRIGTRSFTFDPNAKSRLQDVSLSTGKFPAGRYVFHFQLVDALNTPLVRPVDVEFNLKNNSRVELRSPRDGETTNEFPLFEFAQDGNRAILTVAEQSPDQSREDAITKKPPMIEISLEGQNSFLYSGGRPLESGKTYVWRVVSSNRGSGGTENEISSPIGLFSVSSVSQTGIDDVILNQLEEMLGYRYASVFQQIRNGGLKLTGTFSLNGSSLSRADLQNILNQLREIADNAELTIE